MSRCTGARVPYRSQWESADLVGRLVSGEMQARDDPLWRTFGASSPEEYEFWSWRACGVACLRMVLAAAGCPEPSPMTLIRELTEVGAYEVVGGGVIGLVYRPFVELINGRDWPISGEVAGRLAIDRLESHVRSGGLAMVSVDPAIRDAFHHVGAPVSVTSKGGHLVLVIDWNAMGPVIHNPSGWPGRSQERVRLSLEQFDAYFAGRGVLLAIDTRA